MHISLSNMIGLAGVSSTENFRARQVGRWFEWPMLFMAALMVFAGYSEPLAGEEAFSGRVGIIDVLVWCFFLLETLVLLWCVDDRRRYLLSNWCNVLILAGGVLMFLDIPAVSGLRVLRLLVILTMLLNTSGVYRQLMTRNHLGSTLAVCFFIILISGTVMSVLDPNVQTPLDGIWWAWVTVTTVGYGDIVPSTSAGRLFASFLILMGIGLVSLLTASISALFVRQNEASQTRRLRDQKKRIAELEAQLHRMETKLDEVLDKLS